MFKKISERARELKEKADLSSAVSNAKQIAANSVESGKENAADFIERNWPKIEETIMNGLLSVAEDKLKDDKILESLLGRAYELLPVAVRLVLPRTTFIEFSMTKREPLLLKLQ